MMGVQLMGRSTWLFSEPPGIIATAVTGGPKEGRGPLKADFDYVFDSARAGKETFEQAEQEIFKKSCELVINKAAIAPGDINYFISGDLMNQITSSSFVARSLEIPYIGIFGACSSAILGMALGSQMIAAGSAQKVLTGSVSHNCTAERQFRYPNEYGCQKPAYSQYTATAAGAAIIGGAGQGSVSVIAATLGRVVDLSVSDPFNMGAAMAPAAANTVFEFFKESGQDPKQYDLIVTGDLSRYGREICWELLTRQGFSYEKSRFVDCGMLLYGDDKNVFAGGSGCGCVAAVSYGHLYNKLANGKLKRILIAATGALLSPVSSQQCESIPGISHAVALEGN